MAEPKTTYALIKARWNAGSRTRTETSIRPRWQAATGSPRVLPDQRGGGCEIRTREALPPTRFPSLRLGVRLRSPISVTCDGGCFTVLGGRC